MVRFTQNYRLSITLGDRSGVTILENYVREVAVFSEVRSSFKGIQNEIFMRPLHLPNNCKTQLHKEVGCSLQFTFLLSCSCNMVLANRSLPYASYTTNRVYV